MKKNQKIILLADDDAEDQDLLEEAFLLLEPNAKMIMLSDGKQVMDYLDQCADIEMPQLIILDYKMPLLNAEEVLEQIALDSRFNHIPKIVWSSSNFPEHRKICMERGAADYFTKPNTSHALISIAKRMLEFCN